MFQALWSRVSRGAKVPLGVALRDVRHLARQLRGERAPVVVPRPLHRHVFAAATVRPATRTLRVVDVLRETHDAISLVFESTTGDAVGFVAGQFLTLRLHIEGTTVQRAYSLSSSADDPTRVAITVKRVPGGLVSNYLHDRVAVGDVIEVLGPSGSFSIARSGNTRHCVLIAGGSGITPMMAALRTHLGASPELRFTLLYGNRDEASVIFHEALRTLAARHSTQLRVVYALEHPSPTLDALSGRFDATTLARALDDVVLDDAWCYLCGPQPMMDAARSVLASRGVDASRIREERFTLKRTQAQEARGPRLITLRAGATTRSVTVPANTTLLDAGLMAGVEVPYSCTMGGCGACRVRVTAGAVTLDEPNCLTADEREAGFTLACCARAVEGPAVEVEVPA
jgi:ferredoxin-NADP reductase